jgi:hypothetical protein
LPDTAWRSELNLLADGRAELIRLPEINFIDDGAGKPVGIKEHIGQCLSWRSETYIDVFHVGFAFGIGINSKTRHALVGNLATRYCPYMIVPSALGI